MRKLPLLVAWLAFLSAPAYSQCGEVDESALRWNRIMRWAFPLAFGLMMVMLAI